MGLTTGISPSFIYGGFMRFLVILIIYLYLSSLHLIANEYNNLLFYDNFNNIEKVSSELLSVYNTIELQSTVSPGDSVFIDLKEFLEPGDTIINITTNNIHNKIHIYNRNEEVGSYKLKTAHSFIFYLDRIYCNQKVHLLLTILNINKEKKNELILSVKFRDFTPCIFAGNYICNFNFEKFQFATSLDLFKPYQGCVNAGIHHWYGSSSDMYSRRNRYFKPSSNSHPYSIIGRINHYYKRYYHDYYDNMKLNSHIYYNPDTYDGDIKNTAYIGAQIAGWEWVYDETSDPIFSLRGESIYQNLIKPLIPGKKYILEYYALLNTYDLSDTKFSYIGDINIYGLSYLADYDPCTTHNPREIMRNHNDKFLIDTTLLEQHKWMHIKSKVFSPDKPMTWFWLGAGRADSDFRFYYRYGLFFDDVIIREAGAGISSSVSSYYPCIGDTLEYTFKIWKDDPENKSDIEVHNLLPSELIYLLGDFHLDTDGILKVNIPVAEFDERGIAWLSIKALVPPNDSLHGKELTNEIYFPDMPVENRPSVGKYKISVYPGRNIIDIQQKAKYNNKCQGDTVEVTVTITNTSTEEIEDLMVTFHNSKQLDIIYQHVLTFDSSSNRWIEILRPELYFNGKIVRRFGYLEGEYISNERDDIILRSIGVKPYESIVIKYYGVLKHNDGELIVRTSAHPQHQSCKSEYIDVIELNKYNFTKRFFPSDTIACSPLRLESPYPEFENYWSTGTFGQSIEVNESGVYTLTVTDSNGCKETHSVYVHLEPEFDVSIVTRNRHSPFLFKGDTVDLIVRFRHINAVTYSKRITFNFDFDKSKLTLINRAAALRLLDSSGSFVRYNCSSVYVIPPTYDKNIEVMLRFIVHDVSKTLPELIISSLMIDDCLYIANHDINLALSNPDVVKLGEPSGDENLLDIYPSPFSDKLTIRLQIIGRKDVRIKINDLIGRHVKEVYLPRLRDGVFLYEIDTSEYADGFYNICMFIDDSIVCKKSIKIGN